MNANIKKRNKTPYKYSKTQKTAISGNSILSNFYSSEYDNFKSTVSNITKQLNNMSLGAISKTTNKNINYCLKEKDLNILKNKSKDIFNITNIKNNNNISIENEKENKYLTTNTYSYKNVDIKNSNIIISKNYSLFIAGDIKSFNNNTSFNHENELRQENNNLKENIKFLLGQVKKYQKSGIVMEDYNINNNDIEYNNKIKEVISEKNIEIEKIKKIYEKDIKLMAEKISTLEMKYKNLKTKYNELKKKYNKEDTYRCNNKIDLCNSNNNENLIKLSNSEIIKDKPNSSREMNRNQAIRKINKIFNNNANLDLENSKNIEDYYYHPYKNGDKRFTFHRTHHTTDFTNDYFVKNIIDKRNVYNRHNMSNNNNNNFNKKYNHNTHNTLKLKNLKIIDDKGLNLNNTYLNGKDNNNYFLIKKDNMLNNNSTKGNNNISFLYKKSPIKTEIINNNNNDKSSILKNLSSNLMNMEEINTNYQKFQKFHKNYSEKDENVCPKLIRKLSSTLYRKKNNKKYTLQNINNLYNNSYNNLNSNNYDKYYTKENDSKNNTTKNNITINNNNNNNISIRTPSISFSSRFSNDECIKIPLPLPQIDLSPNDLYYFPKRDENIKELNKIVYKFSIDKMSFSTVEFLLNKNSSFNVTYPSSINHDYDIILSIKNGFFIITGEKTNNLYYYNKNTNYLYDLSKLNNSHSKGSLIKINNEQIICISGINSVDVEMYYIKDNLWINLPKMNCCHSESSYMVYNNNIIFSFFGYDYANNKFIDDIEYLFLNNYNTEQKWKKANILNRMKNSTNYNLRNHSIFYRLNKENDNTKDIFIVGGYNVSGRNNGLIQVFIENLNLNYNGNENNSEFNINFKKYEENKVKIKGVNNMSLDKYNNMENLFLFSNEFYQFFDDENNLFYSYNYDNNFNIHIIDNFTLKHTIYRNKLKK